MTGRRILITGSSGYLGRALVSTLLDHAWTERLIGLDVRSLPVAPLDGRFLFVFGDVADPLEAILRQHCIDTIIHAAFVLRPSHDLRRMERTNLDGTRMVLRAAASCNVQHLIHLSSASVYGFSPVPMSSLREDAPLNPQRGFLYAEHKAETDRLVHLARAQASIPSVTVLRPSFIIGRDSDNPLYDHLTRRIVLLPATMSSLQLTHIDDVRSAVMSILDNPPNDTFNLGAHGALSPLQMVQRLHGRPVLVPPTLLHICNELAWKLRASWLTNVPSTAIRSLEGYWLVNSERIEKQLGFRFRYDTEKAFDSFVTERAIRRYEARFSPKA